MTRSSNDHTQAQDFETLLTHGGRDPHEQYGFVNAPIVRGSTVIFETLDQLESRNHPFGYGRRGNPTSKEVQDLVTGLEGAAGTVLTPSGLAAITTALLSVVGAGDEVLVSDSVYGPTRQFCDGTLKRLGVTTRYYDPRIGGGIAELLTERTRAVFAESPGSLTFEVQDLPAISEAVKDRDIAIIVDNSWATPLFYRPLALGADIVVHAGTKMFVGHSDALFGTVSGTAQFQDRIARTYGELGLCVAPEDAFLTARGLRTLSIRMNEHKRRALDLAQWLEGQDGVVSVLHPALPSHPDNALFRRDFSGSGSLFGVVVDERPHDSLAAMVDNMELFGMGYSWGGYESLLVPANPRPIRTAVPWTNGGQLLRIHVGFESPDDLKADLERGLARYFGRNG